MNTSASADKTSPSAMRKALSFGLLEFFWGDAVWYLSILRVPIKLAVALFAAWLVHEHVLAARLWVAAADIENLVSAVQVQSDRIGAKFDPPKNSAYSKVGLCVLAKRPVVGTCPEDADRPNPLTENDVVEGLGYSVLGIEKGKPPLRLTSGAFFRVRKHFNLISEAHIEESVDTLLRRLELALFNGPTAKDTKLCAGTRTLLAGSPQCSFSASVGQALGAPTADLRLAADPAPSPDKSKARTFTQIIGDLRISSMFVGPIQFGTLLIFWYALLETLGLWLRWVAPPDHIKLDATGKELDEAVSGLASARVISIQDRLAIATMKGVQVPVGQEKIEVPHAGEPRSGTDVEVLSSYRDFLHEEAAGRQDILEMLGDTMLKLAFLGTVFGISTALFSARGLDTADPILRLATKATMYAGIGLGFGTTILGITCSIIAALFRSSLAAGWSREIGAAYQSILKNLPTLQPASRIVPPNVNPDPVRHNKIPTTALFGILVLLAFGLYVAYSYREALGANIIAALDRFGL